MKTILAVFFSFLTISCSTTNEISAFKENAVKIENKRVVAYFEPDVLTLERMNEIVDTMNLGIQYIDELFNGPLDWQLFKNKQITYNFKPGRFISHTTKSSEIEIPVNLYEIYGNSPWLHETLHILLRSEEGFWWPISIKAIWMPQWFAEGMAEYLSMKISNEKRIAKPDLLHIGNYFTVDSICLNYLKSNHHTRYILRHIGEPGYMIRMRGRKGGEYYSPFYSCSSSFTKYLEEKYGLDLLLLAYSNFQKEHRTIEKETGKKMRQLKNEWLIEIGYSEENE